MLLLRAGHSTGGQKTGVKVKLEVQGEEMARSTEEEGATEKKRGTAD